MLAEAELAEAVLLVFANKQDLPKALPVAKVSEELGLAALRARTWHIQGCCATTGDGLYEGEWRCGAAARMRRRRLAGAAASDHRDCGCGVAAASRRCCAARGLPVARGRSGGNSAATPPRSPPPPAGLDWLSATISRLGK